MTRDEFIKRYHNYSTRSKAAAVATARLVNVESITNGHAVAVRFGDPGLGYGIMLQDILDEYLSELHLRMENSTLPCR